MSALSGITNEKIRIRTTCIKAYLILKINFIILQSVSHLQIEIENLRRNSEFKLVIKRRHTKSKKTNKQTNKVCTSAHVKTQKILKGIGQCVPLWGIGLEKDIL